MKDFITKSTLLKLERTEGPIDPTEEQLEKEKVFKVLEDVHRVGLVDSQIRKIINMIEENLISLEEAKKIAKVISDENRIKLQDFVDANISNRNV